MLLVDSIVLRNAGLSEKSDGTKRKRPDENVKSHLEINIVLYMFRILCLNTVETRKRIKEDQLRSTNDKSMDENPI